MHSNKMYETYFVQLWDEQIRKLSFWLYTLIFFLQIDGWGVTQNYGLFKFFINVKRMTQVSPIINWMNIKFILDQWIAIQNAIEISMTNFLII